MTQKAFSKILILIILAVIVAGGVLVYQYSQKPAQEQPPADETADVPAEALATEDWEAYRNEEYGFEVKYPSNFEIRGSSSDGTYVNFSPYAGTYVTIRTGEQTWKLPLRHEYMSSVNSVTMEWEVIEQKIEDDQLSITQERIVIDEENGHRIILRDEEDSIILSRAYIQRGGDFFVIDQSFNSDIQIFNQILSTFRFLE